jgi:integrase
VTDSTRAVRSLKAQKPHKTSDTLTARGDGRWCKKYKDKFGVWRFWYFRGTEQEALDEWGRVKGDLLAGRSPNDSTGAATVRDACNKFLTAKLAAVNAGTIHARTFMGYKKTTDALVESLGRTTAIGGLRPDDFSKLYRSLTEKHGAATLGREITIVRSVFKYALESDLIDRPVKFGPEFKAPSKRDKRRQRNKSKRERGARMFTAHDIRRMINVAGPQLRAMILLGINGGLGNTDCAALHLSHLDLENGWLDYPRPKTEIDRRIPLWPETVKALKHVAERRRSPSDTANANLVFLTRLGQPWVRYELAETKSEDGKLSATAKGDDAIAKAMRTLLGELKIYRRGVTFYALRHTFETIAGGCRDQVAVDAIMGHVDETMAAEYRENIEDERLKAAVNHVRQWLFAKETKSDKPAAAVVAGKVTAATAAEGEGAAAAGGQR